LRARAALRIWVGIREREAFVFITRRTWFLGLKVREESTPGDKDRNTHAKAENLK
jgi:hypothetical protein